MASKADVDYRIINTLADLEFAARTLLACCERRHNYVAAALEDLRYSAALAEKLLADYRDDRLFSDDF